MAQTLALDECLGTSRLDRNKSSLSYNINYLQFKSELKLVFAIPCDWPNATEPVSLGHCLVTVTGIFAHWVKGYGNWRQRLWPMMI